MSSWATCHKISIPPSQGDQTVIPLGDPLLGTQVEVRDVETGDILTSGYGQIWIGIDDVPHNAKKVILDH